MTQTDLPRPDAVIFDIGNVLITWHPEARLDEIVGEARRRAMTDDLDVHAMNERIDRGEDFREVVYGTAEAYPDHAEVIRMWHDNWLNIAGPVIDRSVRILHALRRAGVPVFALSNFGVGSFAITEEAYPFLKEFDRRYISGHMQVTKPSALIYQMVEEDCCIAPERLLFADDKAENIEAAAARGWQTHLFTGPEGWAARLVQAGLLTEEDAQ